MFDLDRAIVAGTLRRRDEHVGQLAMLRRLADSPVPPENFIYADIHADRLDADQPPPARPDQRWPDAPSSK